MTKRENFRIKVREFCDTLDLFDNIKDELLKSHSDLQIILKLDDKIRKTEKELADMCVKMSEIDTCSCTVNGSTACSSPLCPSRYNELYKVVGEKTEK